MKYMGRAARMQRHHKRHKGDAAINLVSMIDMLTVLVFFLLVYSTEKIEILPSRKDVQLPESIAEEKAHDAVVVIVSEKDILINGKSVGKIDAIMAMDGVIIPELKTELETISKGRLLGPTAQTEEEKIASREVTIMADRQIPYQLLKKVMATSTAAEYGQLSLAVLQKASDLAMASVARN